MPLGSLELPTGEEAEGHTWDFRIIFFSAKDIKGFLFTLEKIVNPVEP